MRAVVILSAEPLKVRITLAGKEFLGGPLDELVYAIRKILASWAAWEQKDMGKRST